MATETCDIAFYLPQCFVANESIPGAVDGAITVFATGDSGGTKKYNLGADFTYATQGQTSGSFTNLVAGTYTVYARSSGSCMAVIQLTVGLDYAYNPRFTNRYYGHAEDGGTSDHYWRWDIEKRDYVGAVEEVKGKFSITWGQQGSEDPFKTIIPSACSIEVLSETDEQFLELYTGDEREFKVIIYKWDGADWAVWWMGYALTGQYFAPYDQETNYTVSVVAADMLEGLREIPYGNADGTFPQTRITIMEGILLALQRTEIELDVYEGIQLVITGVTNSFDATSMAETAYFDPSIYYNDGEAESCYDVLDSLLRTFWSRIYQAEGRWNIETITQKSGGTFNVRTRDLAGAVTGAGYLETEPRLLVRKSDATSPRLCFQGRTQGMKISETFGTIRINYDYGLEEENNLLLRSDFEDVDAENGQFADGWQYTPGSSTIMGDDTTSRVITVVRDKVSRQVLEIAFRQTGIGTYIQEGKLSAAPIAISAASDPYYLNLTFDIFPKSYNPEAYIYFDVKLSINVGGTLYYVSPILFDDIRTDVSAFLITADGDPGYIRRYVNPGVWSTIDFTIRLANGADLNLTGTIAFDIQFYTNKPYDVEEYAGLAALSTASDFVIQNHGNKRRMHQTDGGLDSVLQYSLVQGVDIDDYPNVIRPGDYGSQAIHFVWKLDSTIAPDNQGTEPHVTPWMQSILVDNVVIQYLPNGEEPEGSETTISILNKSTKHDLEVNMRHGDDPGANLRLVTRGWLSFDDLTQIINWKIRPASGGLGTTVARLLKQAANAYRGQYNARRWKQTGTYSTMQVVPSFFNTFYEVRTGKVYLPTYLMVDSENSSCDSEQIEVISGLAIIDEGQVIDPVTPPDPIEPPAPEAGRVHVEAFAEAFN